MTTTEDPYVRVEREDLRIGMRFDYRLPDEPWDTVERTLTSTEPLAYDSGNVGHVTLQPDDITEEHEFYAHRDDITLVPTLVPVEQARAGEPIALNVGMERDEVGSRLIRATRTWLGVDTRGHVEFEERSNTGTSVGSYTHVWALRPERVDAEPEAESTPIQVPTHNGKPIMSEETARANQEQYDQGVRDGYMKAQQEHGAEQATGMADRPAFRREDAVVLAIQALGGSDAASHALIPLAEQIEAYVNGTTGQGDVVPFPKAIKNDSDAALPWPEGTTAVDNVGDGFERRDGQWWWVKRADGSIRDESTPYGLSPAQWPATIIALGAGA